MTTRSYTFLTSVHGQFEKVYRPLNQGAQIDVLVVTDSINTRFRMPNLIVLNGSNLSPRLANRLDKMLYYHNLDKSGLSVYVDANVRPINDLVPLFQAFKESGADLGMYRHYARASVHEEARACLHRNKIDNPAALEEELKLYDSAGFPDTGGMWEGSVIFKRHDSPGLSAAMEEWWELYSRFETRDQFSLPFVIWKHGLSVFDLDDHKPGRGHYFVRLQHSQAGMKNRLARYLQARAPENAVWRTLQRVARSLART